MGGLLEPQKQLGFPSHEGVAKNESTPKRGRRRACDGSKQKVQGEERREAGFVGKGDKKEIVLADRPDETVAVLDANCRCGRGSAVFCCCRESVVMVI